jgi:hypothetical protein
MSNTPNQVYINQDTANQVIVNQESPNLVTVRANSGSANTRRHEHAQGTASATWTITHTLGGKPSVTIVDSADTHVFGEVQYNSNTQITVMFSSAFSGKAYLT